MQVGSRSFLGCCLSVCLPVNLFTCIALLLSCALCVPYDVRLGLVSRGDVTDHKKTWSVDGQQWTWQVAWQLTDRKGSVDTMHRVDPTARKSSYMANQSINLSLCKRRHNSSLEMTSQRRRSEPQDWTDESLAQENCSVVAVLTFGGSRFHVVAAATANARSEVE